MRLDPRGSLRWIRWAVLGLALVGVVWLRANFALVRPDAVVCDVWDLSGGRMLLVKRLGERELPSRRSILLFGDRQGERVARVAGLPGDALAEDHGKLRVAGRTSEVEVDELGYHEVPSRSVLVFADDLAAQRRRGASIVPLEAVRGVVLIELPF